MFRMDVTRKVAALAVVAALALGSPLAAAGWEMPARWAGPGDFLNGGISGIFARALAWLGVNLAASEIGGSIDPNGSH